MSRLTAAFLLFLISPLSTRIAAQERNTPAALSGTFGIVVDSIHGGPLVGAVVSVNGTNRQATTDAKGYYRIDSVPPGVHQVSLHHPILDTLGMAIGTKPIDFPAGYIPVIPLGIPSDTGMLKIACPKVVNAEGPAGLLGVVRDPDTHAPAVGAQVSLSWIEVRVDKEVGARSVRRTRTAVVDSAGNYAICGLPADLGGRVQATLDGAGTAGVEVAIGEVSLVALRSLSLGASELVVDTVNGVVRKLRRGPASLRGRVVGSDGHAVAGAQVEVPGTAQATLSTQTGAFSLSHLPAGTQAVVVRNIGFNPSTTIVELSAKTLRDITVALGSVQILDPIEAKVATAGLERVGFTERKRIGIGRFITREDIARRIPIVLTDIFTTVPGIRLTTDRSGNQILESTRNEPGQQGSCVSVFVDRLPLRPPMPDQLVRHLNLVVRPEEVQAIEVYQVNQVPGEFSLAGQRCLTLVIWTRAGVGEPPAQANPSP